MALVEGVAADKTGGRKDADVVLGDDWIAPDKNVESEVRNSQEKRGIFSLNRSPLTRKIITFNLVALNFLVAGILFLNSSRDTLAEKKAEYVRIEAELIADVFEARTIDAPSVNLATGEGVDVSRTLDNLEMRPGLHVFIFDAARFLVGEVDEDAGVQDAASTEKPTVISDFLLTVWSSVSSVFGAPTVSPSLSLEDILRRQIEATEPSQTRVERSEGPNGATIFTAFSPIEVQSGVAGTVALVSYAPEIDAAVRQERENVLQMFVIATLVSIGLSLVLASTISNPISNLADAAEVGRDRNRRNVSSGRIRIPDLTARPDEIGRLSGALRASRIRWNACWTLSTTMCAASIALSAIFPTPPGWIASWSRRKRPSSTFWRCSTILASSLVKMPSAEASNSSPICPNNRSMYTGSKRGSLRFSST